MTPAEQRKGACLCGEDDCWYLAAGYPYCRSCEEHHRPPECPIDERGRSLDPDGKPWADLDPDTADERRKGAGNADAP